jgi:hypothetical protein
MYSASWRGSNVGLITEPYLNIKGRNMRHSSPTTSEKNLMGYLHGVVSAARRIKLQSRKAVASCAKIDVQVTKEVVEECQTTCICDLHSLTHPVGIHLKGGGKKSPLPRKPVFLTLKSCHTFAIVLNATTVSISTTGTTSTTTTTKKSDVGKWKVPDEERVGHDEQNSKSTEDLRDEKGRGGGGVGERRDTLPQILGVGDKRGLLHRRCCLDAGASPIALERSPSGLQPVTRSGGWRTGECRVRAAMIL